ncbi:MAG: hypothetical protein EZS28_015560 [Streblomastix strix]|uniref:Uncharacterized protein n=1 Tax=Streblomastix strix TaxID=222440 RepID=A0A5J4W1R6_9EUKA|nr:MAG: hypothetical protein EZS28_015560 [Streblomastix strix]
MNEDIIISASFTDEGGVFFATNGGLSVSISPFASQVLTRRSLHGNNVTEQETIRNLLTTSPRFVSRNLYFEHPVVLDEFSILLKDDIYINSPVKSTLWPLNIPEQFESNNNYFYTNERGYFHVKSLCKLSELRLFPCLRVFEITFPVMRFPLNSLDTDPFSSLSSNSIIGLATTKDANGVQHTFITQRFFTSFFPPRWTHPLQLALLYAQKILPHGQQILRTEYICIDLPKSNQWNKHPHPFALNATPTLKRKKKKILPKLIGNDKAKENISEYQQLKQLEYQQSLPTQLSLVISGLPLRRIEGLPQPPQFVYNSLPNHPSNLQLGDGQLWRRVKTKIKKIVDVNDAVEEIIEKKGLSLTIPTSLSISSPNQTQMNAELFKSLPYSTLSNNSDAEFQQTTTSPQSASDSLQIYSQWLNKKAQQAERQCLGSAWVSANTAEGRDRYRQRLRLLTILSDNGDEYEQGNGSGEEMEGDLWERQWDKKQKEEYEERMEKKKIQKLLEQQNDINQGKVPDLPKDEDEQQISLFASALRNLPQLVYDEGIELFEIKDQQDQNDIGSFTFECNKRQVPKEIADEEDKNGVIQIEIDETIDENEQKFGEGEYLDKEIAKQSQFNNKLAHRKFFNHTHWWLPNADGVSITGIRAIFSSLFTTIRVRCPPAYEPSDWQRKARTAEMEKQIKMNQSPSSYSSTTLPSFTTLATSFLDFFVINGQGQEFRGILNTNNPLAGSDPEGNISDWCIASAISAAEKMHISQKEKQRLSCTSKVSIQYVNINIEIVEWEDR